MLKIKQLQKFCAKIDILGRETHHLNPFHFRGHIYATDNRICIRIKDDGSLKVANADDSKHDYSKLFNAEENCDLPIPPLPARIECNHCNGTCIEHDCPACEGEGKNGCKTCGGKGVLETPSDEAPPCWWCNGGGEQEHNPVAIGDIHFNRKFLALAAEMPGSRFVRVNGYEVALIKFEGGEIAIMPTRV